MQIYRLRDKGQRLDRAAVIERGPVSGEFSYRERTTRSGIYLATLVIDTAGKYGLPPLDRAALRRVTPHGMMVFGMEVHARSASIKSSADYWPQAWWCVPYGLELSPPLANAIAAQ
jgi:hypothetical protein